MTERIRMSHPRRAIALAAAFVLAVCTAAPRANGDGLRDVVLVGNSASGTVSFLDGHTFQNLGSFNVIPDLQQRLAGMNPVQFAAYLAVRQQEGGDRFADDVYLSPDGRTLYVSRGNLADVAAFDVASKTMKWRFQVAGFKADHAVLSPDGTRLIVSATTASEAQVIDTATGQLVTNVPTGTYPHANDYSPDGKYLYNSSIGITALPQFLEGLKGSRQITVIDPSTFKVIRTYTFAHGVRPAAFTRDDRTAYLQLSYLNGFVEFDLTSGQLTRTVQMPYSAAGQALAPDKYPNNSAHHGMALSGDESRLCDVGTIDDYTAVISRPSLTTAGTVTYPTGSIPYWATTSVDGLRCLVTLSGQNKVSVIDYRTSTEIARIPVGSFPQRERLAKAPQSVLDTLSSAAG
jgi:YVTN family beta-propeller protein